MGIEFNGKIDLNGKEITFAEWMRIQLERLDRVLIRNLQYIGEECLNAARSTDSYKDQTGNLRSSTGYVIALDGKLVKKSSFEVIKEGSEGKKAGLALAKELIDKYPKGAVLIVVAGMDYAVHVANKGYDVLDSAELTAEMIIPKVMKDLKLKKHGYTNRKTGAR